MTEKRFTINIEDECIDDAKKEIFIHFYDGIDFYGLCEFLNKLNDENEQLKKQKKVLIDYMDNWCPKRVYNAIIKRMEEVE